MVSYPGRTAPAKAPRQGKEAPQPESERITMPGKEQQRIAPLPPRIIPREKHNIPRSRIGPNVLKVLYRLKNAGYKSYLVGGCVRDLLLDKQPKDFDVATDAHPEQIRELFRNCRLIGRRFRLAHILFGREIVEVSTFRASHDQARTHQDGHSAEGGRIVRDNVYGDIEEDVWRRDFTVNALFYNIQDFSVVDYVGGMKDIQRRQLRPLGDPDQRYREDPVRMLRAVRFAVKLDMEIEPEAAKQIRERAPLLEDVPAARLFEEFLKMFLHGHARDTFRRLRDYRLFGYLFPAAERAMTGPSGETARTLMTQVLTDTDRRYREDRPVSPALPLAALFWHPVQELAENHCSKGLSRMQAMELAGAALLSRQIKSLSIPRLVTATVRDIWEFQARFEERWVKQRRERLQKHPALRASYDFLALRHEAGEEVGELVQRWRELAMSVPAAGNRQRMRQDGRRRGSLGLRRGRGRGGRRGRGDRDRRE